MHHARHFFFTLTVILAFFLLYVFTVILAIPVFFAVTFPLTETDATDFLLEVNVNFRLAVPAGSFTFNVAFFPFFNVSDFCRNEIFFGAFLTVIRQLAFCHWLKLP